MLSRKYNLSVRYFYSTLNRYEKRLYKIIAENLLKRNYTITYDESLWGHIDISKTYFAVIDDFPELFYLDTNRIDWGKMGMIKVYAGKRLYSDKEIERINKSLEEISHKFDHITDPFELEVAVNDFICKEYIYSMDGKGAKTSLERHTPVGLIKRKKGVCSAFSQLAQYILQNHGVPVAYFVGESNEAMAEGDRESYHAWLAVKLGGHYYHLDITQNMGAYGARDELWYPSFNKTDVDYASHYSISWHRYPTISCDSIEYEYYHKIGRYFESFEQMAEGVEKFYASLPPKEGEYRFEFLITPEMLGHNLLDYFPNTVPEHRERLKKQGYTISGYETDFYDGFCQAILIIKIRKAIQMKLTVTQPAYNHESEPPRAVREFLKAQLEALGENELMVLPEYSNAGGLNDAEEEKSELKYAREMKLACAEKAKEKGAYVAVNVLERRGGKIKNSTYLYGKDGKAKFVYDKVHLPVSELELGVERGNGECTAIIDGIRFAFMTCYDVYFSEQIEYIADFKPDVIILCGYQRGERAEIIRAQSQMLAFRCNSIVLRSSYSMDSDKNGGCSMIIYPNGKIAKDLSSEVGAVSLDFDIKTKHYRENGYGRDKIRNDEFIENGKCAEVFEALKGRKKRK